MSRSVGKIGFEDLPERTKNQCGDAGLQTRAASDKGPIRILCDEIGFAWDPRLERADLLVAFVRGLVAEVAEARDMAVQIASYTGKSPSAASSEVLALADVMLASHGRSQLLASASYVHEACHRLNPDDAAPTDHIIDMLSSCASAIRFGLEKPCHSRHAASAAQHVWRQLYGISRFDSRTPAWENDWARSCLQNAIISLLPVAPEEASPRQVVKPIRDEQ